MRGGAGTELERDETVLDSGLVERALRHSVPRIRDINSVPVSGILEWQIEGLPEG